MTDGLSALVNQQQQQPEQQPGMAQGSTNVQPGPVPGPPPQGEDFLGDLGLDNVPDGISRGKHMAVLAYGSAGTYEDRDTGEKKRRVSFAWRIDNPQSQFNGELVDNDFCHANAGMDNRDRRKLRDRLQAIGAPTSGMSEDQLNAVIASRKGAPVMIDVYTDNRGQVRVSGITSRDANLTAQMQQAAAGIQGDLRNAVTPTGQAQPPARSY